MSTTTTQGCPAKQQSPRLPSKTAIAKAERAARVQARQEKRVSDANRLTAAREQIALIMQSMPADFQDWGVVRTRAYMQLREIALSKMDNVTIKPDALENYLAELRNASNWTLDYCQHLTMLHARAADIGAPA